MAVETFDYADGTLGQDIPNFTVWSGDFVTQSSALTTSTSTSNSRIVTPSYSDGTFSVDLSVSSTSSANMGLIFRGVDSDNYWAAFINTTQNRYRVTKYIAGVGTTVYDTNFDGISGVRYLRVRALGENIEIYLNGDLESTIVDSDLQSGTLAGLRLDSATYSADNFAYQSAQIPTPATRTEYTQSGMALSSSKVGQIASVHSQIIAQGDSEEFWPYAVETANFPSWPSTKYPAIMYSSSDHSTGSGGIFVRVFNSELGAITSPSSWEEWQDVSGRTEFDHISTKTCPIYVDTDYGQTETPTVLVENGNVRMFYHTNSVDDLGYPITVQNTHLATSPNGIDFTKTQASVITYNPRFEQGDGHTGYLNIIENPFSAYPYTWLANTTHGGGDLNRAPTQAFWGSDDLINWVRIETFGRQIGEIFEFAPSSRDDWIYTLQSVATIRQEGAYWRLVLNLRKDVVSGGDDTPYYPCEVLIDDKFNVVSAPNFFTSLGTTGEFDQNEMQHYNEIEYLGQRYAFYKAADSSNVSSVGMLSVQDSAFDWTIIRSHADETQIQSYEVGSTSGLVSSEALTASGDKVQISVPASGAVSTVVAPTIIPDDYGMVELFFKSSGKVGAEDISGYVGLFDDIDNPQQAISLKWPSEADGTNKLYADLIEGGVTTSEPTRKVIGVNSDGGLGNQYEDARSAHEYGIRIIPAERVMYVMDGRSPTSKHFLLGVDTSSPMTPAISMQSNDGLEGSFQFEEMRVVSYSNDEITALPLPTISVTQSDAAPTVGDDVTFTATATDANSIAWSSTGGISLNATTGASIAGTVTAEGAYSVTATATGDGGSASDTVNGTAQAAPVNQPPTANAGIDQSVAAGVTVQLDGTGSTDGDGTIVSYSWAQTAGDAVILTGASTSTPSFTAPSTNAQQTLTFELTVTDNEAATDTDTVDVVVAAEVVAPIESTLTATLTGIVDGTYITRVIDTDTDTVLFSGTKAWASESASFTLSVEAATNVEYYAYDSGTGEAGLQIGVTA